MQKAFFNSLLSFVAATLLSVSEASSDVVWSGWLGPNRDGRVDYFEPPAPWPKKLKRDWSLTVGEGSAMPVVANGRAYQHARQKGDEVVWCLDLSSGKVLWRKTYRVPYRISHFGESQGDGPQSNPTLADGRLFTLSVTGILSAWDASSGKLLWRHTYSDRYRNTYPKWGHSTSPLVDGDQVVVHVGGEESGMLVAYEAATGKELWKDDEYGSCHASPILVEIQGVPQIVEWNHVALVGVESQSGRRLWSYDLPHRGSNQNSPTPIFHQGRFLIGGENRGIRSLEPQRVDGKWRVTENWHQRNVSLNMASAVISDDSLYGLSQFKRGQFFRLNPLTGEPIWLGPPRMGDYATFLTIPGHIVALRDNGVLEIFASNEDQYLPVASYDVTETDTWAAPVLLKDGILVKDRTKLYKWSF